MYNDCICCVTCIIVIIVVVIDIVDDVVVTCCMYIYIRVSLVIESTIIHLEEPNTTLCVFYSVCEKKRKYKLSVLIYSIFYLYLLTKNYRISLQLPVKRSKGDGALFLTFCVPFSAFIAIFLHT